MNDNTLAKIEYSYIIKIDDNYKIIYKCSINNDDIIMYLQKLYLFNEIIVYNLCNNPILEYINNRYGFINTTFMNDFDINTFCKNINYFDKFISNDNIFTLSTSVEYIVQDISINNLIYIYYNFYFNDIVITNIIKPDIFNEFILIYNGYCNKEQIDELIELQDNIFNNIEIAKYNINKIINKKIINTTLSIFEIKELIHKHFDIDNKYTNKIKFSDIWLTLLSKQNINEDCHKHIKKQLPKALEEMGLSKKRLTNGIYWCGLVMK